MTTITPLHHIRVALERNPYDVVIGDGSLARLGQQMLDAGVQAGRRVLVVSNPDVASPYGDACLNSLRAAGFSVELLVIDAGETQKTPATVAEIHDAAYNAKLERSSLMVALGGGVVGDAPASGHVTLEALVFGRASSALPETGKSHDRSL